jgi:CelD/BcsL family acetyltransferase involved in cellulose biosynthesis
VSCATGIAVVRDPVALTRLWRGWDRLAANPMQHSSWIRAWLETFEPAYEAHIVVAGPLEQPRAIAPLVARRGRLGRLELISVRELGEPVGVLSDGDSESLAEVGRALIELGEPLILQRLAAQSPLVAALRSQPARTLVRERPSVPYSYVDLDRSWAEQEGRVSARRRADLRRKRRAAEKLGPLALEDCRPAPGELEPLLEEALRIEASGWKGRAGTALVHDRARAAFYRAYLRFAAAEGLVRIFFLRVGDRRVAVQVYAEYARRLWQIKVGYDEAFARISPGMLLTREVVGAAARDGLDGLEFLGAVAPWTQTWSPTVRRFVTVRVYPLGLRRLGVLRGLATVWVDAREAWHRRRQARGDGSSRP